MCVTPSHKGVLTSFFLERTENPPFKTSNHSLPYTPQQLKDALSHYNSCSDPTCETCQVARMLELRRETHDFQRFHDLRKHIRQTCSLGNLSEEYRTQTLEMSKMMYSLFLHNTYREWLSLRNAIPETSSYTCRICFEGESNVNAFNCGHCVCVACSNKLLECPLCRSKIILKIPVYL